MAGFAGIDGLSFNDNLQPAVTACGAGLAFPWFLFAQEVLPVAVARRLKRTPKHRSRIRIEMAMT
jgi:hypothetical protein